jgi:hypothetical protein
MVPVGGENGLGKGKGLGLSAVVTVGRGDHSVGFSGGS